MREGSWERRRDRQTNIQTQIVRDVTEGRGPPVKEQVQEDRAGYVLPFRTTKSQISESVVEFCEQGPPEDKRKKSGDGRTVGEEPQAVFLAILHRGLEHWNTRDE